MDSGCLICGVSLEDKNAGAKTCGPTHAKQWQRLPDEERDAILQARRPKYPRQLDERSRLNRCEKHGEIFTELFVLPQGWPSWEGRWMASNGCLQCKLESDLQPRVKALFESRQDEYRNAIDTRLQAASVQRAISEETERLLAPKRDEIRADVENERRSEIAAKVSAEMQAAILAELKAEQHPEKPIQAAEKIEAEREAYIADLMRPRSPWDTTRDAVNVATHAGRRSLGQE